ncbi:DUF3307 domain-containing protein [Bradyrhizobium roseum]|uniref:DUF3307 domain-containing protein n=1 Tax=Bradyrhizobium roseum TaxID=3056648 RepID=UPI00262D5104|nr:DUF3307 domain-containing protein [Bradyrhizobium roseus]WKA31626.1 DUF3307 domain-containing protein [Bradyrhizobium roseus]
MSEYGELMHTLFLLVAAHALCDYPLQGDWLSKAKNPTLDLVAGEMIWPLALLSHATIHAAAVLFITGSPWLAACEFFTHALIDYEKCRGLLTYNGDQILHLLCKALWVALLAVRP